MARDVAKKVPNEFKLGIYTPQTKRRKNNNKSKPTQPKEKTVTAKGQSGRLLGEVRTVPEIRVEGIGEQKIIISCLSRTLLLSALLSNRFSSSWVILPHPELTWQSSWIEIHTMHG